MTRKTSDSIREAEHNELLVLWMNSPKQKCRDEKKNGNSLLKLQAGVKNIDEERLALQTNNVIDLTAAMAFCLHSASNMR